MCRHRARQPSGPAPLLTTAEILLAMSYRTLPLLAGLCQLPKQCRVAAAKRYVQHSNLGRVTPRIRDVCLRPRPETSDILGPVCGRNYGHLDVIRNTVPRTLGPDGNTKAERVIVGQQ